MGLTQKFRVERTDGRYEERDHYARYFVLNYVGDRHARVALEAYADSVEKVNPVLAVELRQALLDSMHDFHRFGLGHDCDDPREGCGDGG